MSFQNVPVFNLFPPMRFQRHLDCCSSIEATLTVAAPSGQTANYLSSDVAAIACWSPWPIVWLLQEDHGWYWGAVCRLSSRRCGQRTAGQREDEPFSERPRCGQLVQWLPRPPCGRKGIPWRHNGSGTAGSQPRRLACADRKWQVRIPYRTVHRIKIKDFSRFKLFCRDFHSLAVLLSVDRKGPSRFQEEPAGGPHSGEVDLATGAAPSPRHLLPPPLLLTLPHRPPLALLAGQGPHPWPPPGGSGAPSVSRRDTFFSWIFFVHF